MSSSHPPLIESFPPLAAPGARVLVLGTMPGVRSLEARQYYAHPQNAFWRIMAAIVGFEASLAYADRVAALTGAGIAVWDVLGACRRQGSLDSAIEADTVVVNDLKAFLATQPDLRCIACNGSTAARLFTRHFEPEFNEAGLPRRLQLPSTSPAHARLRFEAKLAAWRRGLAPALRLAMDPS